MLDAWAMAQKLHRSFTYDAMPLSSTSAAPAHGQQQQQDDPVEPPSSAPHHPLAFVSHRSPLRQRMQHAASLASADKPLRIRKKRRSPAAAAGSGGSSDGHASATDDTHAPGAFAHDQTPTAPPTPHLTFTRLAASKRLTLLPGDDLPLYNGPEAAAARSPPGPGHASSTAAGVRLRRHRDVPYPCPLGCAARCMPGWQVPGHVLEQHLDLLLQWAVDERRHAMHTRRGADPFQRPAASSWAALAAATRGQQHVRGGDGPR